MSDQSLLPPNATALDKAVEAATRLPADLDGDIGVVGRVADCPEELLGWLAWAMSVDVWDSSWDETRKRSVIAAQVALHRRKGTIGAVRQALATFGFGNAVIVEGQSSDRHDGSITHDGTRTHGVAEFWARYRVFIDRPLALRDGQVIRDILANIAPAGCELAELNFTAAANRHDGTIFHDGTFTHGAV